MNKADKEYVDAQVASVENKFKNLIGNAAHEVSEQDGQPNFTFPVGFTQKDGQPVVYIEEDTLYTVALKLLMSFNDAKIKLEQKAREEGKKTPEEWYADIFNENVKNWRLITDCLADISKCRQKDIEIIQKVLKHTDETKAEVKELKSTVQSLEASNKPKGIYMFGKHISGWYFFPFIALLFIFLWFFASGYFEMKEEAKLANVKLQVIRDDFGHHPPIKHVLEMLDSTCANPIPPKIEKNDNDD
ncbi:MAG: hypothetical protein K6A67_04525 [Bacteroidales bacterium]|nr:hypothetical protein [Bacteroidales bacterium]